MNRNLIANLILNTDSYKLSHWKQYPKGTENTFSYIESRGCEFSSEIMMFGLQYFLKKYLTTPVTMKDVNFAKVFAKAHGLPFNEEDWTYIVEEHKGILPLRIRAIPEGTVIPLKNVMATVESTDPKCFWLPSYMETAILRTVWYASTVATNSFLCKRIINDYLEMTSDDPSAEIAFKLHDFGARGVNTQEGAAVGGMAHIVNFMGSDTIEGILTAMEYYDTDVCAFSITASEHSTMTPWLEENEKHAYGNMVEEYAEEGVMFACVSDSYDIYNATRNIWAKELLPKVKEKGATVVIRPDSGDPTRVPIEIIQILMEEVGYTINSKGYKVLPDYVRVIQGDGINRESLEEILRNMEALKLSATNIAFGMGGGLLQQLDRDTFKFAMKCSAAKINGKWVDVYKDPITDKGKRSKRGRITLVKNINTGEFRTIRFDEPINPSEINVMRTVYHNGIRENEFVKFEQVRNESEKYLKPVVLDKAA